MREFNGKSCGNVDADVLNQTNKPEWIEIRIVQNCEGIILWENGKDMKSRFIIIILHMLLHIVCIVSTH